jgi:hypothetical protein
MAVFNNRRRQSIEAEYFCKQPGRSETSLTIILRGNIIFNSDRIQINQKIQVVD